MRQVGLLFFLSIQTPEYFGNHLFQHRLVNVGQFVEIETTFAGFVFPEPLQFVGQIFCDVATHQENREVLFVRRKAKLKPVAFASAGIVVVVTAKANNTVAPHGRVEAAEAFHHFQDLKTVFPFLRRFNRLQKGFNRLIVRFGFQFGHVFSFLKQV